MIGRIEGRAGGAENVFGISPRYEDLHWDGLDFTREQFASVIGIDKAAWQQELELHAELFEQLAYHLPAELPATKARIEAAGGLSRLRGASVGVPEAATAVRPAPRDRGLRPRARARRRAAGAGRRHRHHLGRLRALRGLAGAGAGGCRQPRVRWPRHDDAWPALREHCAHLGLQLLQRETVIIAAADGRRVRFVGATRWSDFDLFGAAQRERAKRAAAYFMRLMAATRGGAPFGADGVREEAWPAAPGSKTACRAGPRSLGHDGRDHALRAQPAQRGPALRPPARHRELLQCRRRPAPARRSLAARPPALPPRLPRPAPGRRPTRVVCQARGLAARARPTGTDRCA